MVPIGRPIANTQIYVVDSRLEPSPIGVWGELLIGGVQVARGYHRRPELTAEKFVPNPFGPGVVYRTGDLGRWNADGVLEFGGRIDEQVKLRGFRIELGEIEAVLRDCPAVADGAVVVVESAGGRRELAAYAVPATDSAQRVGGRGRTSVPRSAAPRLHGAVLDHVPGRAAAVTERQARP